MASVGFVEGFLTHEGREHLIFQGVPPRFPLLKWFNKSMLTPMPHHCILLATSSACVVEAFTVKGRPHIVGMQCNNHAAHPDDLCRWLTSDIDWFLEVSPGRNSGDLLLEQAEVSLTVNEKMFVKLISNFVAFI